MSRNAEKYAVEHADDKTSVFKIYEAFNAGAQYSSNRRTTPAFWFGFILGGLFVSIVIIVVIGLLN